MTSPSLRIRFPNPIGGGAGRGRPDGGRVICNDRSAVSAASPLVARQDVDAQVSAWQPAGQTAHLLPTLDPHATGITNTVEKSYNWSGYVDTGPTFTAISAQWVVPTVQPSQLAQYSSTWIGIDGFPGSDASLIQTGTAQQTSGGVTSYYDWWEIITPSNPAPAMTIGAVSPGDHMTASIYEVTAGTWMIAITDVTSGSVFSEPFAYSGTGSSAEWIEEAPTVGGGQSTLADFGSASFSNMADTNSGSPAVTPTHLDMVTSSNINDVIATPGSIANNAFTITYTGPVPTTTTVSVSPSSSTSGEAVTYSASVTSASGTPTGTVTFTVGSTTLCTTGALVGGSASCSTTTAPEGTDTITGTYSGSSGFTASSGTATLVVNAAATSPTPTPADPHAQHQPPPPRRHRPPPPRATATGWSAPMAGSSPTVRPSSTGRRGR